MRLQMIGLGLEVDSKIKKGTIITRPKGKFFLLGARIDFVIEDGLPSGRVLVVSYKNYGKIILDEVVVDFGVEGIKVITAHQLYYDGKRVMTTFGC